MKKGVIIAIIIGVVIIIGIIGPFSIRKSPDTQVNQGSQDNNGDEESIVEEQNNIENISEDETINQPSEPGLILYRPNEDSFDGVDDFIDITDSISEVGSLTKGTIPKNKQDYLIWLIL